jgi:hypothetical protein
LIAGLAAILLALMFAPVLCAQNTGVAPSPATDVNSRLARLELQAADAKGSADNAWMLTSSALVLMMTGPGLALWRSGSKKERTGHDDAKLRLDGGDHRAVGVVQLQLIVWAGE